MVKRFKIQLLFSLYKFVNRNYIVKTLNQDVQKVNELSISIQSIQSISGNGYGRETRL